MNLVEPGTIVNNWTVEIRYPTPVPEDTIEPLSWIEQFAIQILSVQPMTGECGNLFKTRYEPKMLAESEIPALSDLP